jgi:hypothetical protein
VGETASGLRPTCRLLELDGDTFVVGDRRTGPVSSPPVEVTDRVRDPGKRSMRLQALLNGCGAVGGGACQGMTKIDPPSDFDQPSALGGGGCTPVESEFPGGGPQQRRVAFRLRLRQRQEGLCVARETCALTGTGPLRDPSSPRPTGPSAST